MHYDFIEIGTSDFRTYLQSEQAVGKTGLVVEPLIEYLERLPDREGWTKVNTAISGVDGTVTAYGVRVEVVKDRGYPNWLRGCNSIDKQHPSVVTFCKDKGIEIDELVYESEVPSVHIRRLFEEMEVESIGCLKIDTEGMDALIMMQYFECVMKNKKLKAARIEFEDNELSNPINSGAVIYALLEIGYTCKKIGDNILATIPTPAPLKKLT